MEQYVEITSDVSLFHADAFSGKLCFGTLQELEQRTRELMNKYILLDFPEEVRQEGIQLILEANKRYKELLEN